MAKSREKHLVAFALPCGGEPVVFVCYPSIQEFCSRCGSQVKKRMKECFSSGFGRGGGAAGNGSPYRDLPLSGACEIINSGQKPLKGRLAPRSGNTSGNELRPG